MSNPITRVWSALSAFAAMVERWTALGHAAAGRLLERIVDVQAALYLELTRG